MGVVSSMDAHINRAADYISNDLPVCIGSLFESNEAMYNTALYLFAEKRKMSQSLHDSNKWLAAAVVLAVIVHLEVRKASSALRNKALRQIVDASRERLLAADKQKEETKLAAFDEKGVRDFLSHVSPSDVDRVVAYLRTVQKESMKFRPLGAFLSSMGPGRLQKAAGVDGNTVDAIRRSIQKKHHAEKCAKQAKGQKRRFSSQDNVDMVIKEAMKLQKKV